MNKSLKNLIASKIIFGSGIVTLISFAAIAFAIAAQFSLTGLQNRLAAGIFLAASIILWGAVIFSGVDWLPHRAGELDHPKESHHPLSRSLAGGAIALAVLTFLASSDNSFTSDNVLSWTLSITLFLYAFWDTEKSWADWRVIAREKIATLRSMLRLGIKIRWNTVLFVAVMALGSISFYYRLDQVPGEMISDHAEKLLDVNDVLEGARPIFFIRNTGREPFQFYLTAAFIWLTGHPLNYMALKWVTASLGLAVVAFTFFLTRELFDDWTAFIAAALVAVSKWLMVIARIGLRFPLTPFFIAPLAFFMFRALKYQKRNDFLMLGLILGTGLFGYNAFRIAPLLVAIYFVVWPLIESNVRRQELRSYVTNALLAISLAAIVFMPLLRYMFDEPGLFWYRMITRVTDAEQPIGGNPIWILSDNVKNVLLMFNVRGDVSWPNNVPQDPALDFVMGGLFILGIVTAVYRLVRFRETPYAHMLLMFLVMLIPSALAIAFPIENPGNNRTGGAIPFAMMITALPLVSIARGIQSSFRSRVFANAASVSTIAAMVLLIASVNYQRYFVDYEENYRKMSWNSSEVAAAVRAFADSVGDTDHAWLMLYPHWVDMRNVAINLGEIGWQDHVLPDASAAEAHVNDRANKLYILNPNDANNLARLQELFPSGQLRVYHSSTLGHDFVMWYVPGSEASQKPVESVR